MNEQEKNNQIVATVSRQSLMQDLRQIVEQAISGKPDELIKKELANLRDDSVLSPDLVFKSPYFLEFTGLKGMYSEKRLCECKRRYRDQKLHGIPTEDPQLASNIR